VCMYICHGLLSTINANAATKLDRPMTLKQHTNAIRRRPPEHQQNQATLLNLLSLLLLLKDTMGGAPKEEKRGSENFQERGYCQELNSNGI